MFKKILAAILNIALLANCNYANQPSISAKSLSKQLGVATSGLMTDSYFLFNQIDPSYKRYFAYGKAEITPDNYAKLVDLIDAKQGISCRIPESLLRVNSFIFVEFADLKTPLWWTPSITKTSSIAGWETDDGTVQLRYEKSSQSLYAFFEGGLGTKCMP